mgnify:CR=1 FL=1
MFAAKYDFSQELLRYGPQSGYQPPTLRQARAYCRRLARRHYENFTAVTRLLPRRLRQHFSNIYAYCRWADDLADEAGDPRTATALLGWWEQQLRACYQKQSTHPVFVALGETIERFKIPITPFVDLLSAFRQDQHIFRYETFDQVLEYCRYSAHPVGRLVLHLAECHTPQRCQLADSICTGLQLVNFCQDVPIDWQRGRIYLSCVDRARFGCEEDAFRQGKTTPGFARVLAAYCDHAEGFLRGGWPLVALMPYEFQLPTAAFVHGGLAAVEAIRRAQFDVWATRPRVSRWTKFGIILRCWWRHQRGTLAGNPP